MVILLVLVYISPQDSLQVVLHRFSDGVEVVKCVLEFCKVDDIYSYRETLPNQT